MHTLKLTVVGSGNIGTDLSLKVMRLSNGREMRAAACIDPGPDARLRPLRDRPLQVEVDLPLRSAGFKWEEQR